MADTSRSRKANCAEDLRRRILTQELEPGSTLDETELAAAYEMSRPPLRETLRQLAGEGYVVLRENRAAQVAPMSHKSLRNFFVVAPMIYSAVSRLAALHATRAQVDRLRALQAQFRAAIREGDTAGRALTNERFHALIGEMADNEYLLPSLRRLLIDHTRIGMTFYSSRNRSLASRQEVAADQHDQFIDLIEAGDADGAAALAIAHWELSRAEIESFVTPPGLDIPLGASPSARETA
ncbi:GntR family transcriptional regulator [Rubellimicrobium arenae]|uniref:GntR family transcriptional regulator n=1 Tax=Rubellimicrobium arenae TaxID=2817372 RepID=UPI001B30699C|nr:GntR family transcriptional regulator [Rubellimicrobium arenae]